MRWKLLPCTFQTLKVLQFDASLETSAEIFKAAGPPASLKDIRLSIPDIAYNEDLDLFLDSLATSRPGLHHLTLDLFSDVKLEAQTEVLFSTPSHLSYSVTSFAP